ncbi:YheC/YheD family protein [Brevibacillus laterosporus]|uniref:YheC/YheD family protein n=1 Tax=Brevibacillus laterosporus TaxID=1465 RepID=UPI00264D9442|nr:YheC/YheD family protein [Brevibacillus laterosporus]MDN9010376.1 YheC/YheD family protein [Brevibacillus laterosporus]MDO0941263.1 YheC/YheD family protein [Brevibacillus laterosporus]
MRARNKWSKYLFLKRSKKLAPYLPKTQRMTKSAFWDFINHYGKVILKPVRGKGGAGVIQVSSLGNRTFNIHSDNKRKTIKGKRQTYRYLKNKIKSTAYMIQRRISLATIRKRPFDMRIIVQRRRYSDSWKVTAKAAKVAGKGYFVTNNTRSKGRMMHVKRALQKSSLKNHSHQLLLSNVKRVALLSAKRLRVAFPSHRTYGMDMGLDKKGHVWIIETNHYPAISHFRKLGDKAMVHRILSYQKRR